MIKKNVCLQIAIHIEFYKGFDPIMQSSLRTKILASSFLMFPFSVKLKISIVLEKWTTVVCIKDSKASFLRFWKNHP